MAQTAAGAQMERTCLLCGHGFMTGILGRKSTSDGGRNARCQQSWRGSGCRTKADEVACEARSRRRHRRSTSSRNQVSSSTCVLSPSTCYTDLPQRDPPFNLTSHTQSRSIVGIDKPQPTWRRLQPLRRTTRVFRPTWKQTMCWSIVSQLLVGISIVFFEECADRE